MGWASSLGAVSRGGEQDSEPVMLKGAEAVGQASGLLDEQIDCFGAAVGDAMGLEPGEDVRLPHLQSSAEAADLGIGQSGNESMTCSAISRP